MPDNVEVFGLAWNLFDRHSYVFGTLCDITLLHYRSDRKPKPKAPTSASSSALGRRSLQKQADYSSPFSDS
jgi:hypothetical protein